MQYGSQHWYGAAPLRLSRRVCLPDGSIYLKFKVSSDSIQANLNSMICHLIQSQIDAQAAFQTHRALAVCAATMVIRKVSTWEIKMGTGGRQGGSAKGTR